MGWFSSSPPPLPSPDFLKQMALNPPPASTQPPLVIDTNDSDIFAPKPPLSREEILQRDKDLLQTLDNMIAVTPDLSQRLKLKEQRDAIQAELFSPTRIIDENDITRLALVYSKTFDAAKAHLQAIWDSGDKAAIEENRTALHDVLHKTDKEIDDAVYTSPWGTIAKVGAVVGAAAATVVTAGGASPALAGAISLAAAGSGIAGNLIEGNNQGALQGVGGLASNYGGDVLGSLGDSFDMPDLGVDLNVGKFGSDLANSFPSVTVPGGMKVPSVGTVTDFFKSNPTSQDQEASKYSLMKPAPATGPKPVTLGVNTNLTTTPAAPASGVNPLVVLGVLSSL